MTTSKIATVAAVILYGGTAMLTARIHPPGAFVHLQKRFEHPSHAKHSRRLPPAVRLFQLAEKNLSIFAPRHHGLDVAALCELLRAYADQIVEFDYKVNPWSPETAPKLKLL